MEGNLKPTLCSQGVSVCDKKDSGEILTATKMHLLVEVLSGVDVLEDKFPGLPIAVLFSWNCQ